MDSPFLPPSGTRVAVIGAGSWGTAVAAITAAGIIADFCAIGGQITKRVFPPLNTTDYSSYVRQLPPPGQVDGYFWVVGGTGTGPALKAFEQAYGTIKPTQHSGNLFLWFLTGKDDVAPRMIGASYTWVRRIGRRGDPVNSPPANGAVAWSAATSRAEKSWTSSRIGGIGLRRLVACAHGDQTGNRQQGQQRAREFGVHASTTFYRIHGLKPRWYLLVGECAGLRLSLLLWLSLLRLRVLLCLLLLCL